ncbi:MAG TPA: hypothetical protein VGF94_02965 [Kofleriaceae bacterium]
MRVSTPWRDAREFVAAFCRYCSEDECFVPTRAPRKPGVETAFSIRLADGTPMLRGLCVVLDCWTDAESPFGRAGVNLGIRKLSPHSTDVLRRMLEARAVADRTMPVDTTPTVEMPPLFAELCDAPCEVDEAEDDAADLTVPTRAPIMTLLGVAPVAAVTSVPHVVIAEPIAAKLAAPASAPIEPEPEAAEVETAAAPRRAWWMRWLDRMRRWVTPRPAVRPRLARVALPALRLFDPGTRSTGQRGSRG